MNRFGMAGQAVDDLGASGPQSAVFLRVSAPNTADAMLRLLSATSEGFAYGATALATAIDDRRHATIAANMSNEATGLPNLSCWRCHNDERGIDLVPFAFDAWTGQSHVTLESGAAMLVGNGGPGDVLIVCDPWGENDLLCWALRLASYRRMTTIAITTEQPSLLAALAGHAVRVPVTTPFRQEYVVTALRYLVQTAGGALESGRRGGTNPLRTAVIP